MEIRRLLISEYDEIVALWLKSDLPFRSKGRDKKSSIAAEMKSNPDFFIGAFDEGHLIGVAIVSCDLRKGWINRLAVHPEYRNRGIAEVLVSECEDTLRKHGMRIFCALIEEPNLASRRLFRKCGYVAHGGILYFSKRESEDV